MAYSRKNKKNIQKKRRNKNSIKRHRKKTSGGGCGCSRIVGGSPYLSDLSPQTYYAYNSNIQNDPNNHQISTRMADVPNMKGGQKNKSLKQKQNKKQKQKQIIQRGGLTYSDFTNSLGSNSLVNSVMNTMVGSNVIEPPTFLQNALSVNQPDPNSTIPFITPGIKYLV